jgi:hypothetical protein
MAARTLDAMGGKAQGEKAIFLIIFLFLAFPHKIPP